MQRIKAQRALHIDRNSTGTPAGTLARPAAAKISGSLKPAGRKGGRIRSLKKLSRVQRSGRIRKRRGVENKKKFRKGSVPRSKGNGGKRRLAYSAVGPAREGPQPLQYVPAVNEENEQKQQEEPAADSTTGSTAGSSGGSLAEERQAAGEAELEERYRAGFREGYVEGGEGEVSRLLPPNTILCRYTARDLIAAGLSLLAPGSLIPLLPPEGVAEAFQQALAAGRPLSLIRLGDGELLTLAHDAVISAEEARVRGPFLPYAGVELPDYGVRHALVNALQKADIIGVPESRHPSFQGLLFPVLAHYGLDPVQLRLTSSTVNYALAERQMLLPLLQGRSILLIGDKAAGLAPVLAGVGVHIAGIIPSVRGAHDAENAIAAAAGYPFDLALVSAGIAAVIICSEISVRLGKPAIDFGHMANKLESGEMTLR